MCHQWLESWHHGNPRFTEWLLVFLVFICHIHQWTLSIYRGIYSPKHPEKIPLSSPLRAMYVVSFWVHNLNKLSACFHSYCAQYRVRFDRDISRVCSISLAVTFLGHRSNSVESWKMLRMLALNTSTKPSVTKQNETNRMKILWFTVQYIPQKWWTKSCGALVCFSYTTRDPFHLHGIILNIPAWINNHRPSEMCDEITYSLPNLSSAAIEIWEWMSNFVPHQIVDEITYLVIGYDVC